MSSEALVPTVEGLTPETAVELVSSVKGLGQRLLSWIKRDAVEDVALAKSHLEEAETFTVDSPEARGLLGNFLPTIKRSLASVEEKRLRFAGPLHAMFTEVNAVSKEASSLLTKAETVAKNKCLAWDAQVKAEQDRLRREAEASARKEQERLNKIAEEKARRAEAAGKVDKAEEIRQTVPQVVIQAPLFEEAPKVAGESSRTLYRMKVVDEAAFYTAIGCGIIPLHMADPNFTELNKVATALKKACNFPGCEVVEVESLATRAR